MDSQPYFVLNCLQKIFSDLEYDSVDFDTYRTFLKVKNAIKDNNWAAHLERQLRRKLPYVIVFFNYNFQKLEKYSTGDGDTYVIRYFTTFQGVPVHVFTSTNAPELNNFQVHLTIDFAKSMKNDDVDVFTLPNCLKMVLFVENVESAVFDFESSFSKIHF